MIDWRRLTGQRPGLHSDLDLLVVIRGVKHLRAEGTRLRGALRGLLVPVDIVVATPEQLERLGDVPGMVYRMALKEGKVVYERAGGFYPLIAANYRQERTGKAQEGSREGLSDCNGGEPWGSKTGTCGRTATSLGSVPIRGETYDVNNILLLIFRSTPTRVGKTP